MKNFLKKKNAEDWAKLRDKEIDDILGEIDPLAKKIGSLKDHIAEFSNAVRILKKNKKDTLVQNVHLRASHLSGVIKDLKKEFGDLQGDVLDFEKIDKYIKSNFFTINISSSYHQDFNIHFNKNEGVIIGRGNVPVINSPAYQMISRKHLRISWDKGDRFICQILATFPSVIIDLHIADTLSEEAFTKALHNQGSSIYVNEDHREFVYANTSEGDLSKNKFVFSFEIKKL